MTPMREWEWIQVATRGITHPRTPRDRVPVRMRRSRYDITKRTLDLVIAIPLLVLLLPFYPFVALAIWLDSPGSPLFCQQRVGKAGRPFTLLKFRSMVCGADPRLHEQYVHRLMVEEEPAAQSLAGSMYKVGRDPRVTRVGRILRTTSIDEWPQLWNVLRGEMSLVGPRPDLPYAVSEYASWQRKRLEVLPGITGLWQVSGRSRLSPLAMMRLDVRYVEERSLWLDIRILARTLPLVLRMRDAC